jgi:hypothetical protein
MSADGNAVGTAAVADELGELVGVPAFVAFGDSAGTTRTGGLVDAASAGAEELAVTGDNDGLWTEPLSLLGWLVLPLHADKLNAASIATRQRFPRWNAIGREYGS